MVLSADTDHAVPEDYAQLELEARRLRDYLMRVGSKAGQKLVAALGPFERAATPGPDSDAVQKLYGAFQAAYEEATATLDRYTIDEVISGNSPHAPQTRGAVIGAGILTAIGIMTVLLALFYSFWASSAAHTLHRAERFVNYDHFSNVMKLVEFERFFEPAPDTVEARDLQPFQMYLEDVGSLYFHYRDERDLPIAIASLAHHDNPFSFLRNQIQSALCPDEILSEETAGVIRGTICLTAPEWFITAQRETEQTCETKEAPAAESAAVQNWLRSSADELWRLRTEVMLYAGRDKCINADYRTSRHNILNLSDDLRAKLNNVRNVWLPMIYGFLGSIVHCMWRMLSPGIAPYRPMYTVMRTAFAGLAALTLTMILVPSNTLTLGAAPGHPLVYLVAFIFGYSIEAFINTLNNLNRSVGTALSPKDRGGGK